MVEIEIDPELWCRGYRNGGSLILTAHSLLLNEKGFMCCLGFAALGFGATKEDITGVAMPEQSESVGILFVSNELGVNVCRDLAGVNDNISKQFYLNDQARIDRLNSLLSETSKNVRFKLKEE